MAEIENGISFKEKNTILVTGASGQLGSELQNLSVNFPFYNFLFATKKELSIEDKKAVNNFFEKHTIQYCINCAAYTAVDKAESEKEKAFLVNADAAGFLADACNKHQAKFIHISTDYVYDESIKRPLKENDAVAPLSVYGLSKLKGEKMVLNKNPSSLIIRTSWVYSSYGNNFVKTMLRLFKEKQTINVINDQLGCPTYAADIAAVVMEFINGIKNNNEYNGIVNYCNEGIITWFDFAIAIKEFVASSCNVLPIPTSQYPTPAKRPQYSVLDTSKIKEILKIDVPFWKESLYKCLELLHEIHK